MSGGSQDLLIMTRALSAHMGCIATHPNTEAMVYFGYLDIGLMPLSREASKLLKFSYTLKDVNVMYSCFSSRYTYTKRTIRILINECLNSCWYTHD